MWDVDKLPDLIETIALFNQNNREVFSFDNEKWIIAEYEDLRKAIEHGKDYFIKMSLDLDQIKQDILDFMEFTEIKTKERKYDNLTKEKKDIEVEVPKNYRLKEIVKYISKEREYHENTIRKKMESLSFNGYIETKKSEKGSAHLYHKFYTRFWTTLCFLKGEQWGKIVSIARELLDHIAVPSK